MSLSIHNKAVIQEIGIPFFEDWLLSKSVFYTFLVFFWSKAFHKRWEFFSGKDYEFSGIQEILGAQ